MSCKMSFMPRSRRASMRRSCSKSASSTKTVSKPGWIALETVDLKEHVNWTALPESSDGDTEYEVQETIRSQLDADFFELQSRPGWRIFNMYTAQDLHIFFIWNHPHTDGMGGKIFHRQLLAELNNRDAQSAQRLPKDLILHFADAPKELPPPSEILAKFRLSSGFVIKEAWKDYKSPSWFPTVSAAKWAPIQTAPYRSEYKVIEIPSDVLGGVLAACRKYQTTLTSLINTLALISLATRLNKNKAPALAGGTAIDQRRFLPSRPATYPYFEPENAIGNYVSLTYHNFDAALCSEIRSKALTMTEDGGISRVMLKLLWSISSRIRHDIATRLDKGLEDDMLGLTKFVPDFRHQFKGDVKKPRKMSWFVTNLGVVDSVSWTTSERDEEARQGWSVTRAQFTNSVEVPAAAIMISVVSVKGGSLVITCTYQGGVVEEALIQSIVADLRRWLICIRNTNK